MEASLNDIKMALLRNTVACLPVSQECSQVVVNVTAICGEEFLIVTHSCAGLVDKVDVDSFPPLEQ
jgi:hypothetical protein